LIVGKVMNGRGVLKKKKKGTYERKGSPSYFHLKKQ